jgi:centromere/kinetochore protein ZW10
MFKATAPMFYAHKFSAGQMLLYNDSVYLADQLRHLTKANPRLRLMSEIETIERFGKVAYGKEMHSQRIILTDLLDGSQGFANCTEQPFLGECEIAVNSTVDRIRALYKEWHTILSHSALLQSVGSLLSTVISKMILDIEDLGDISDSESHRLVIFCNRISKLEDLFLSDDQPEHKTAPQSASIPMTAVYVQNWLKFQYLTNILESSLADIKYLWAEGELNLEFSPEEVIDLIKALFTDTDHRRRAITEIRRTSRAQ